MTLYEPDCARAVAGRERIAANLERAVAKGRLDAPRRDATLGADRARRTTSLRAADADLVIEAVFEDLAVKQGLWRALDAVAPPAAIFASNTCSISIDRLAEAVARRSPAAVRRDALLQPGAGHAARRADPRRGDVGRDRRGRQGAVGASSASRSSSRPTVPDSSSTGS